MRIKDQLAGAYQSLQSLSQRAGHRRKEGQLLHYACQKGRHLRIEELEERQLLAVTAAEYAEILTAYSNLGLSETMSDVNIIEVESNDLSVSSLKTAIETAGTTAEDDLIVLRTTDASNTIAYTAATDEISININAAQKGKLTIIGFGTKSLTIDAKQFSRVMTIGSGADVSLANLTITGGSYGGIYNSGTLTVTNSTISGNSAGSGGGIYNNYNSTLTVTNSTISGNSADYYGGGICDQGTLTITNSTISGNSASSGGGIYCSYNSTLTATNNIIVRNYATESGNDIYGALSKTSSHNFIGYNPSFVVAPVFNSYGVLVNADDLDLRLTAECYAINAGSSDVTLPEFDLDGNPRVAENSVDIGAYEFQGTPATEPTTFSTVVNTLEDSFVANDGKWSLREALYWATCPGTITFDKSIAGGTIYLNSRLNVYGMSIDGGSLGITLDAQQKCRVMNTSGDITIKNMIITGGLDGGI